MGFFRNPLKWIVNNLLPMDESDRAGVGPFRPPEWMDRAARLHDISYRISGNRVERRSQADWDLFWRWCLIASKEDEPLKRCKMAMDICKYFPYVRRYGGYFWDG